MQLISKIIIYFLGNTLSKLLSLALLPLFTFYIKPADFGRADMILALVAVVVSISFIEVWNGVLRFMYDSDRDDEKKETFIEGLLMILPLSLVYMAGFFIMSCFVNFKYKELVFIYGILIALGSLYQYSARGLGKSLVFVISGLVNSACTFISYLLLIKVFRFGYSALFIAPMIGNITVIVFIEIKIGLLRNLNVRKAKIDRIRQMIKFCLPLSINSIAYWLLTSLTRVYLFKAIGAEANGLYAIATKFTSIIVLFTGIFTLAWQEAAFEASGSSERASYYTKVFNIYFMLIGLFTSMIIAVTVVIFPILVKGGYMAAKNLLPMYYIATMMSAMSGFLGQIYTAEKKTNMVFYSTLIGAVVNIVSLMVLTPVIGVNAGPISLFLGFTVNTISRYIVIQKKLPIKIKPANYLVFVLLGLTSYVFFKFGVMVNLITCAAIAIVATYLFRDMLRGIIINILGKFSGKDNRSEG